MMKKTLDNNFLQQTRIIVNKHDPIHLLAMGAPDDEYLPEIESIARLLFDKEKKNLNDLTASLHAVFVQFFDPEIAGQQASYRDLARELMDLMKDAQ